MTRNDTKNTKPVSIRLTVEEIQAVRVYAAQDGVSMAEWCRRLVRCRITTIRLPQEAT